ncbi:MAG: fused MFS/spermidine synthase [Deltaproteobacteria bacterium]|nr:fused MFS/spermidine synthase [Deltaproteobacteria bacterium]
MEKRLSLALFLIGFAAIVGQIILIRELLVVFYGNELSTAIILAGWLIWTSLGSATLGRIADAIPNKQRVFALVQLLLSLLLPMSILTVRLSKIIWNIPVGEIVNLGRMMNISFAILAPFCFLSGFLFALGCSLHSETTGARGRSVGTVYLLEAIGSGVGGVAFIALFVHYLNHLQTSFVVSGLLVLSSTFLLLHTFVKKRNRVGVWISVPVLIGLLIVLALQGEKWEMMSRGWGWSGYRLIGSEDTPYGNLTAVSAEGQMSFYENGLWMFTYPDLRTAEESVHFALLEHPEPKEILLIGGGISSSLAQVLQHPSVSRVDYVELDPKVIEMGRRMLPREVIRVLDDSRVHLIHTDGRKYIKTTESRYDVIIVNLPDPMTAQFNRFYTVDFFQEVRRITFPGGIFSLSLTSAENIIGLTLAQLLNSLHRSMAEAYQDVLVLPGATALFFGSMEAGTLVSDPQVLVNRIRQRNLGLKYVRDYYLLFNLSRERLTYFQGILEAAKGARINRDLKPSCYFYDIIHWSAQYTPRLKKIFLFIGGIELRWFILMVAILTAFFFGFALRKAREKALKPMLLYACFVTGYSEMTLNVLFILAFQILYGYVYYKIAILITAYMIGLILGSWHITPFVERIRKPLRILMSIQGGLAIYTVALSGIIILFHNAPPLSRTSSIIEVGFPLLPLVAGYLGGLHFPLANGIYLAGGKDVGKIASLVYGVDLVGSSVGALSAGIILLPVLGISDTLYLIMAFNLFALGLLGYIGISKVYHHK